jgi:hypothetical protein
MRVVIARSSVIAILVSGLACASSAQAKGTFGLVVSLRSTSGAPVSYFKLSGRPGQKLMAGAITVTNDTSKRMRVVLDPVDAMTTSTLGSAYMLPGARKDGPTLWTRIARHQAVIGPGRQLVVTVAVAISRKAKPGDYLSGVSIEAPQASVTTSPAHRLSIASVERYAIGLEVSLPGRRHPRLRLLGAWAQREPDGLSFALLARNVGNVILKGVYGWARVTHDGRLVARVKIGPGTFVTNTAIMYPVRALREMPRQGAVYHVTALMRYQGGTARLSTNVTFGHRQAVAQAIYGGPAVPSAGSPPWWRWPLIAAVATISICGLDHLLLARRRRPKGARKPSAKPTPPGSPIAPSRDS